MEIEHIKLRPVWSKSKEQIWAEVFEPLEERSVRRGSWKRIPVWSYAASLLLPLLLFCYLYTITEKTAKGKHAVVWLPDRSSVTLNAESRLSYKPIAWYVSRKAKLDGEAYFEVKHGSRFTVSSGNKRTKVLGTTFNVYARKELYRVTCLTGQVEVQVGQEAVKLQPNMHANFDRGAISVVGVVNPAMATGWVQGKFVFDEMPLPFVIAEVERQYNIEVVQDYDPNHLYTGIFAKDENSPDEILEIIGKAFGITLRSR